MTDKPTKKLVSVVRREKTSDELYLLFFEHEVWEFDVSMPEGQQFRLMATFGDWTEVTELKES